MTTEVVSYIKLGTYLRTTYLNIITNDKKDFEKELFIKVRSTGKLIKAKIDINDTSAYVDLLEEEQGIAPGQACVFYSKNNNGYKVLGGGWITN